MKKWKKIAIGVGVLLALGIVAIISVNQANKGVVTVQTGKVEKRDLMTLVTASGEVRPKTYSNVGGQGFGKITEILVKEGDKVNFEKVLLKEDGGKVTVGKPTVSGSKVTAKILSHLKGDKVIVFKKKRRKAYQKRNGHRQQFTKISIESIS